MYDKLFMIILWQRGVCSIKNKDGLHMTYVKSVLRPNKDVEKRITGKARARKVSKVSFSDDLDISITITVLVLRPSKASLN